MPSAEWSEVDACLSRELCLRHLPATTDTGHDPSSALSRPNREDANGGDRYGTTVRGMMIVGYIARSRVAGGDERLAMAITLKLARLLCDIAEFQ